ncbi:MAG: class I SAM-dependent methyltransferase [Verrucomicrobiota bacterium]|nr:class I SAM-dependent methyltransferase [Limisphaera sp.]MDW8382099.1 class I SAM-dependent methyltransferase [Verrucomicrobiota bacterium]
MLAGQEESIPSRARVRCPLCEREGRVLLTGMKDLLYGVAGQWSFRECPYDHCRLVWLDPLPEADAVPRLYQRYYTHAAETQRRFCMRDRLYTAYQVFQRAASKLMGVHWDWVEIRYRGLANVRPGRLLDVGCGDGRFLQRMRELGWEVHGCEVDPKAAQAASCRNIHVHVGSFLESGLPQAFYDAVTLHHVIEHLPEPRAVFKEVSRVLRPGGLLSIVTPNVRSYGRQKFGRAWRGWEPPRHFCLFHLELLRRLAHETGFVVQQCRSSAIHADVILGASMSIQAAQGQIVPDPPPISVVRTMRAWAMQHYEQIRIRRGEPCGEECVLLCQKPQ